MTTLEVTHEVAVPVYQEVIASGQATYDLMGFYGVTLDSLGQTNEAIEWYKNALSISPNLADITERLATALVKINKLLKLWMYSRSLSKNFLRRKVH